MASHPTLSSQQRANVLRAYQWVHGVVAVVVGHTPVQRPTARANVINVDTGAAYGRPLTVLDLADVPRILAAQETVL
jgi:serine/threonine protein phosphatase 1